jgi:hypothetical protein
MTECGAVNCSRRGLLLAGGLIASALLAVPAAAPAQEPSGPADTGESAGSVPAAPDAPPDVSGGDPASDGTARGGRERQEVRVWVTVRRLNDSKLKVNDRVVLTANIFPFMRREKVKLLLLRNGHVIDRRVAKVFQRVAGRNVGRVKLKGPRLVKPGRYVGKAIHPRTRRGKTARDGTGNFRLKYPSLGGGSGKDVELFNDLLNKQGYRNASNGSSYTSATKRAVLAFRKANNMERTTRASATIFKRLAGGRGEFKPRHPGAGAHVEVDISRQVMALIENGKAKYTYPVSTGAPATPTIRGHYRFYRRQPGFNSVGMYYSVYFIRGYAIHGYHSVPNYPASHGCVRNPIPDSKFIYNWVRLGMSIYTYG